MPIHRGESGLTDETTPDVAQISQAMSRMRVLIKNRAIGKLIMSAAAPDLDMSHLDVIELVRRGTRHGEVTIGLVAEKMCMDPSRASRVVAYLVDRGILSRAVSQADARRAVIVLTDKGQAVLKEKRRVKLEMIERILSDWTDEEVAQFAELYGRFVDEFEKLALPGRE
ncbi:MarR family transcriptional regulator [uncultured Roseibium sp.]|uniref:MarR family winged helix-turn-helix transcriptional regulator n=1 Tax=uncultured Roseibium sp. TaxID=1936171 RepID=UPI003216A0A8